MPALVQLCRLHWERASAAAPLLSGQPKPIIACPNRCSRAPAGSDPPGPCLSPSHAQHPDPGSSSTHGPAPSLLRWQLPAASGSFPRRGVYPRNVFFPWAAHGSAQGLLCALSWAAPKPTAAGRGSEAGLVFAHSGCALKPAAPRPTRGPHGRGVPRGAVGTPQLPQGRCGTGQRREGMGGTKDLGVMLCFPLPGLLLSCGSHPSPQHGRHRGPTAHRW